MLNGKTTGEIKSIWIYILNTTKINFKYIGVNLNLPDINIMMFMSLYTNDT